MSRIISKVYWIGAFLIVPLVYSCERAFDPLGAGQQAARNVSAGDEGRPGEIRQEKTGPGTAILHGKVYQWSPTHYGPAYSATVLSFRYNDYRDTLAVVFSDSTGSFQLSGLPEGQIDMLVSLEGRFSQKWSPVEIRLGENILEGVLEGAVLLNSIESLHETGFIVVDFKPEIPREVVERIIAEELMTIHAEHLAGTLTLRLPVGMTVFEGVERLIRRQEVKSVSPSYLSSPGSG